MELVLCLYYLCTCCTNNFDHRLFISPIIFRITSISFRIRWCLLLRRNKNTLNPVVNDAIKQVKIYLWSSWVTLTFMLFSKTLWSENWLHVSQTDWAYSPKRFVYTKRTKKNRVNTISIRKTAFDSNQLILRWSSTCCSVISVFQINKWVSSCCQYNIFFMHSPSNW